MNIRNKYYDIKKNYLLFLKNMHLKRVLHLEQQFLIVNMVLNSLDLFPVFKASWKYRSENIRCFNGFRIQ